LCFHILSKPFHHRVEPPSNCTQQRPTRPGRAGSSANCEERRRAGAQVIAELQD
jgi:hypothetical protein